MQENGKYCEYCGFVDDEYDEHSLLVHQQTPKHICNKILYMYKQKKKGFSRNGDGILIFGRAESLPFDGAVVTKEPPTSHHKIWMNVKPHQQVTFSFSVDNDMKNEDLIVVGIQLAHPQPQFEMNHSEYEFGKPVHILKAKSFIKPGIEVKFLGGDVGQYEMPLMFTFYRESDKKNFVFVREMVVSVQTYKTEKWSAKSPYSNSDWNHAEKFIVSTDHVPFNSLYKIPPLLKKLLPHGLEEDALEKIKETTEVKLQLRKVMIATRAIFDKGITPENYMLYFHHLLWWEEIICRINLRKYNMFGVSLEQKGKIYLLEVPGLAENRPSLLRGDKVYIMPHGSNEVLFEAVIKDMEDSVIHIANIDEKFSAYYGPEALFDVRFLMSRVPHERAHTAVAHVFERRQLPRLFPQPHNKRVELKPIYTWYNPLIQSNEEQRSAVQHILSKSSQRAPYMVFGPPGTGKTMTIVEAIIQVVMYSSKYRVMVCTDSNMAADHIALMLARYNKKLNINNFILRANSKSRVWSVMPPELIPVSNGSDYANAYSVTNYAMSAYRIVVTTLLHAAKYGSPRAQQSHKLEMSHLFIDEAAQASEPAALVPVCGLLARTGTLVLAGDPQQLGPVCISRDAKERGLGKSLMARLRSDYANLYESDPNYITMLVKNFRNAPDILHLPNQLFYHGNLKALAKPDPLSSRKILPLEGGESAVVFHSVNSREQRMGKAPSFFNEKELDMLKMYTKALVEKHDVKPVDIGIIAPYIRQVYKMKSWLISNAAAGLDAVEIGTVEAFQGKEKRVILVSTVRANCRLLDYDAKYGLGFLVDDKRFNVTLTRAKAKLIIIGNPSCLGRDEKWRKYMAHCSDLKCYFGRESEQLQRTSDLLTEVAINRFNKCRLTGILKTDKMNEEKKETE
ncbi:putative helicase MOV-10 isoform X2 [Choristoneura fumiferana]